MLPDGYEFRPLQVEDADALAAAYVRNRHHLSRWDPIRPDDFYTRAGQADSIGAQIQAIDRGVMDAWLIWSDGAVVGRSNLANIVRGVLQSGAVGYWVDAAHLRRGLATAAVEHQVEQATSMGLHRLEAGTMPDNVASQKVLLRRGFVQYGEAPSFLFINGAWRDHVLFQRILHDRAPST